MGRLDSELWRFKLRGSLIRHLPLHCKVTHWAWIRFKICGESWKSSSMKQSPAPAWNSWRQWPSQHGQTSCSLHCAIWYPVFHNICGSVKRFQKSTLGYPNDIGSRFPYRIATIWTFGKCPYNMGHFVNIYVGSICLGSFQRRCYLYRSHTVTLVGVIPWQIDRRVTPHPLENWRNFVYGVILGVDFDFDQLGHVKLTVT